MPVFGALILIILAYFKYMGDGPVYDAIIEATLGEKCRTYWWSSLLFIQNYYNPLNEVNIVSYSYDYCVYLKPTSIK